MKDIKYSVKEIFSVKNWLKTIFFAMFVCVAQSLFAYNLNKITIKGSDNNILVSDGSPCEYIVISGVNCNNSSFSLTRNKSYTASVKDAKKNIKSTNGLTYTSRGNYSFSSNNNNNYTLSIVYDLLSCGTISSNKTDVAWGDQISIDLATYDESYVNYQWLKSSNGTSWSPIPGQDGVRYSFMYEKNTDKYYRLEITKDDGTKCYSNVITLREKPCQVDVKVSGAGLVTLNSNQYEIPAGNALSIYLEKTNANISSITLERRIPDNSDAYHSVSVSGLSYLDPNPTQTYQYKLTYKDCSGKDQSREFLVRVVHGCRSGSGYTEQIWHDDFGHFSNKKYYYSDGPSDGVPAYQEGRLVVCERYITQDPNNSVVGHTYNTTVSDGRYAIVRNAEDAYGLDGLHCGHSNFGTFYDHTTSGNMGGMLLVNMKKESDKIYQRNFTVSCDDPLVTLSCYVTNANKSPDNYIIPNVGIKVLKGNEEVAVAYSGDIYERSLYGSNSWCCLSVSFIAQKNVDYTFVLFNNQPASGSGNDIILDDINITACFPDMAISEDPVLVDEGKNSMAVCGEEEATIYATCRGGVENFFEHPYFLYQYREPGGDWTNVPNAETDKSSCVVQVKDYKKRTQFRVIVAKDAIRANAVVTAYESSTETEEAKRYPKVECNNVYGVSYGFTIDYYEKLEKLGDLERKDICYNQENVVLKLDLPDEYSKRQWYSDEECTQKVGTTNSASYTIPKMNKPVYEYWLVVSAADGACPDTARFVATINTSVNFECGPTKTIIPDENCDLVYAEKDKPIATSCMQNPSYSYSYKLNESGTYSPWNGSIDLTAGEHDIYWKVETTSSSLKETDVRTCVQTVVVPESAKFKITTKKTGTGSGFVRFLDENGELIQNTSEFDCHSYVKVLAVPEGCNKFEGWTDGEMSPERVYPSLSENITLTAIFTALSKAPIELTDPSNNNQTVCLGEALENTIEAASGNATIGYTVKAKDPEGNLIDLSENLTAGLDVVLRTGSDAGDVKMASCPELGITIISNESWQTGVSAYVDISVLMADEPGIDHVIFEWFVYNKEGALVAYQSPNYYDSGAIDRWVQIPAVGPALDFEEIFTLKVKRDNGTEYVCESKFNKIEGIVNGEPVENSSISISGTPNVAGDIIFTIMASDKDGCVSESIKKVTIHVNDTIVPSLNSNPSVCINSEMDIEETEGNLADYIYSWNVDGGVITEGGNTKSLKVKWSTSGDKNVVLTMTNRKTLCQSVVKKTITVNDFPIVSIAAIDPVCPNIGTVDVTATVENSPSDYTYVWGGDVTFDKKELNVATVRFTAPDDCGLTRNINVKVTDGNGCESALATQTISVKNPAKPVIAVKSSNDPAGACNPATIVAPTFTVTDECAGGTIDLPAANVTTAGPQGSGCEKTQTWTASYTNVCGAQADEVTVEYTWKEVAEPVLSTDKLLNNPLGCNPKVIPTLAKADFSVTNMCGDNEIVVTPSEVEENGCARKKTYTANYTNGCFAAEPLVVTYEWTEDAVKPEISVVEHTPSSCNPEAIEAPEFSVTDNCDETISSRLKVVDGGVQGDGCHKSQTWTATCTDSCGNVAEPVVVTYEWTEDTDSPVITPSTTTTPATNAGSCEYTVPDVIALVEISDACTADENLQISQSPVVGTKITEDTDVTISVIDGCQNKSEQVIKVTLPTVLQSSITSAESFCFNTSDGVIEGTFEGGQAPYNVSWAIGDEVKGTQEGVANIHIENLPDGTYTVTVTDKNGCHVDQTAIISELKQKVVVTANSDEKTYDGTPLTNNGYTTSENLEPGDAFADVVVEGTRTDVGTSVNKVTSFKIMRGDQDVTCYYDTATVLGNLTINCRPLTITSATHEFTYDGNAHSDATYNVDGLADGESVEVTVEGTIQYVTENPVVNKITAYTFTVGKAENYCIDTTYGKLTMKFECQPITIKANDNSWKYDGESHSDDGYTLTIGEGDDAITETVGADGVYTFANGDVLTVDVAGSVTNVVEGTVANNAAIVSVLNGTVDVSGAYCATVTPGELTITKRNITFTSATDEKVYDGTELIKHEVTVSGDNFVSGEGATFDVTGTRTLVGTSDNEFSYTFNEGTDANNYEVTKVEGTLTVTDNTTPIVITSSDKSFEYDCALHTDEVYTVTYGGADVPVESDGKTFVLPTKDKLVIASTTSGVRYYDATYSENNTFEYTLEHNDQYKGDRDTTFGTLTITKRPIVITANSKDKPYDGIALIDKGFTTNGNEAPCDEVASAVVTGSQTEVGTSDNTVVDAVIKDKTTGDVVTDNYAITYEKGTLEVTPIAVNVTITKHGKIESYDGLSHTVSGYDFSSDNDLFTRDDLKFIGDAADSTATGVEAGKYGMKFNENSFENLNPNFENIVITIVDTDSLIISPISVNVTITKHGDVAEYDGNEHSVSGYDFSSDNDFFTREDLKFIGAASDSIASGVNAGHYGMAFDENSFENTNKNFSDVIITIVETDSLIINPITVNVTITGRIDSFDYDGKPHTVGGYTWVSDNELYNAEGTFTYAGDTTVTATDPGVYPLLIDAELFTNTNKNFSNVTFNSVDGQLTIKHLDDIECPRSLDGSVFSSLEELPAPYASFEEFKAAGGYFSGEKRLAAVDPFLVDDSFDGDSCMSTVYRTYHLTDVRGWEYTCTETMRVTDTIAPQFSEILKDTIIACNDTIFDSVEITAFDNSDKNVKVQFLQTSNKGSDPKMIEYYNYDIERVYIAMDRCGNETKMTQLLMVRDTIPPHIELVNNWKDTTVPKPLGDCVYGVPDYRDDVKNMVEDNCVDASYVKVSQFPEAGSRVDASTDVWIFVEDIVGNVDSVAKHLRVQYRKEIVDVKTYDIDSCVTDDRGIVLASQKIRFATGKISIVRPNGTIRDVSSTFSYDYYKDSVCHENLIYSDNPKTYRSEFEKYYSMYGSMDNTTKAFTKLTQSTESGKYFFVVMDTTTGCTDTSAAIINVRERPKINITSGSALVCAGIEMDMNPYLNCVDDMGAEITKEYWVMDGQPFAEGDSAKVKATLDMNNKPIYYYAENRCGASTSLNTHMMMGCDVQNATTEDSLQYVGGDETDLELWRANQLFSNDSLVVEVHRSYNPDSILLVTDPIDPRIWKGEPIQVSLRSDYVFKELVWNKITGASSTDVQEIDRRGYGAVPYITETPEDTTYYYATISDGVCPPMPTQKVRVDVLDLIPTAFTPHTVDGLNDVFMKGHEVVIFNRYGQKVFEGKDGWPGTYRNEVAEPAVYYYDVLMKDGTHMHGSIEIVKLFE